MTKKLTKEKATAGEVKKEDNNKKSDEKTAKIIVISIIVIVLVLGILVYSVYSSAHYHYMGVEFSKAREGKIDFYTAKLPAINTAGEVTNYAKVDFRTNPKSLGSIPVDFKTDIIFVKDKTVYVSVSENLSGCSGYSGVALINLGRFVTLFGLDVKGAVDDKSYRNNNVTPYVNCNTNPSNTVILVKNGEQTKIEQTGTNCYEISFANCEVLSAVERFELQVMSEYVSRINSN